MDVTNLLLKKIETLSMAVSRCIKSLINTQEKIEALECKVKNLEMEIGQLDGLKRRRIKVSRSISIKDIEPSKN